jgi:subtilisin family serine protease
MRPLKRGLLIAVVLLLAVPAAAPARSTTPATTEVVVTLDAPPLADAPGRVLAGRVGRTLEASNSANSAYLRALQSAQDVVAARIERTIPASKVRWRYTLVLDAVAVVLPRASLPRLAHIPGVDRVWPDAVYHSELDRTPGLIGATTIWGPDLATAGQGMKIGIIDDGIDQTHPFFNPAGFSYPPGFPKGDASYTTPKVIVARAFAPAGSTYANAKLPFDPKESDHGTHVAGIAAGDNGTLADGLRVSGIAPRAYLGNYKALGVPTPGVGLDGNAPEIAAAIEAAVADGMNVVNLSLGEPEIDPSRDLVVRALDGAADAGVVPVVAAGNDFSDFGHGSIGSPGNAPKAISVAASSGGHGSSTTDRIASFSSGGPTPYSLKLKPDVTAPGEDVLSSVPAREGSWTEFSGTSMASPHVAGGAALLMQRHPSWSVAQIKSALVLTGVPVRNEAGKEVPATREGGGRIDLVRADRPFVFAAPTSLSFGLVRPGRAVVRSLTLSRESANGPSRLRAQLQQAARGVRLVVPAQVTVPGRLSVRLVVSGRAAEGDRTGFIVLQAPGVQPASFLRIPFWLHVERPRLRLDRAKLLTHAGSYGATTVGAPSHVAAYRYPDLSSGKAAFAVRLSGPEAVYRFRLRRPTANFGVVITSRSRGLALEPRIVRGGDENRLAGYTALPLDLNPYRSAFGDVRPIAGVVLPGAGTYDIVFDSTASSARGSFTFRFWIGDVAPPSVRVQSVRGGSIQLAVRDRGSGVDPSSLGATIDGSSRRVEYANGIARVSLAGVKPGRRTLVFRAADYQETKNMEDVGPVLPNTRVLRRAIVVP